MQLDECFYVMRKRTLAHRQEFDVAFKIWAQHGSYGATRFMKQYGLVSEQRPRWPASLIEAFNRDLALSR